MSFGQNLDFYQILVIIPTGIHSRENSHFRLNVIHIKLTSRHRSRAVEFHCCFQIGICIERGNLHFVPLQHLAKQKLGRHSLATTVSKLDGLLLHENENFP